MRARRPRWWGKLIAQGAVLVLGLTIVPVAWASLSQSYTTTTPIAIGSLVSLDQKATGSVVVADFSNQERLFGVVVSPSAASISLGNAPSSGQVQVLTNGAANILVSTEGGEVRVGDYIAVSSIAGVGQKAAGRVRIIGTAQADFKGTEDGVTKRTIESTSGKREIALGQIPVVVAVATHNPDSLQSYTVPNWLQNFSNALAGRAVSPIRIVIAGLILMIALIVVAVLLYSAVRNSIISIGRNPLSRTAVLRGLLQVITVAVVILVVTVIAMYLVITK